jgi:hypothetical protein
MTFQPVLFHVFISLFFGSMAFAQKPDPCEAIKGGAVAVTLLTKDSLFPVALADIKNAFALDMHEHCTSFGKDAANRISSSPLSNGGAISSKVPAMANAFADLHNHPNNMPPDAGDLYGLIDINTNNPGYKTRLVVTLNGTLYALLLTDTAMAYAFTVKHPRQPPAFVGGPPGFPVAMVDEAREMKYQYHCTDEMIMAFILEKYNAGVSLLKQHSHGSFNKVVTTVSKHGSEPVFSAGSCP